MNRVKLLPSADLNGRDVEYDWSLHHYLDWQARDLPALAYEVCLYLADCYVRGDEKRIDPSLAAIHRWHQDNDFPDPTKCPSVIALARHIRDRKHPQGHPPIHPPPSIADVMSLADAHERRFFPETPPNAERDEVVRSTRFSRLVARRNRAILLIGFWFGLTTAEVCKLRWNAVTMAGDFLKITTVRINANKRRTKYSFELGRLPLLCPLAALEDWMAYACGSSNYVFPCSRRKALPGPVSSRTVQDSFNKLIKKNNGPVFSMRSLRYSLYFFLADNGWSRQKILRYVPFYKKEASKNRLSRTRRDITTEKTPSRLRAEDLLSISSIIESSLYQTA